MFGVQVQQLQGVYNLQEPHFWTLCTDVYIGTLKLLVAPDADPRWILSQTHHIFTQVPEHTASHREPEHPAPLTPCWLSWFPCVCFLCRLEFDSFMYRLKQQQCRSPWDHLEHLGPITLTEPLTVRLTLGGGGLFSHDASAQHILDSPPSSAFQQHLVDWSRESWVSAFITNQRQSPPPPVTSLL